MRAFCEANVSITVSKFTSPSHCQYSMFSSLLPLPSHSQYSMFPVEDIRTFPAVINQISSTPVTLRQICSYTSERLMHFMFISTHFSRWRHSTARPPVRPRACPPPSTPSAQQTDRRRILSAHSFPTKSFPLNTGPSDFVSNCQLFKIYS